MYAHPLKVKSFLPAASVLQPYKFGLSKQILNRQPYETRLADNPAPSPPNHTNSTSIC
jgi:hypothetical protein